MHEETFNSVEDAMRHLADITGKKVIVAAKNKVENPRTSPENKTQEENWKKAQMWGDYKNHKYPLFNKKTGDLCGKRAMTALRYINQAKGKKSYPSIEAASKVLAKIIKTILKVNPSAKVKYQPKDKVYKVLPESVKKKMKGYEPKSKKASMMDLSKIDEALRLAADDVTEDLNRLKSKKNSPLLDKPAVNLLKKNNEGISISKMTPKQAIDEFADAVAGEDEEENGISKEEVKVATALFASGYEVYHKTYTSATEEAYEFVENSGYEVDQDSWFSEVTTGYPGRPKNGDTTKHHIELYEGGKGGKKSNKKLHFQVFDMGTGSYELNAYIQ
jgi:hypothetical protein